MKYRFDVGDFATPWDKKQDTPRRFKEGCVMLLKMTHEFHISCCSREPITYDSVLLEDESPDGHDRRGDVSKYHYCSKGEKIAP